MAAATVVDVCRGELAKLKEKVVRPRKLLFIGSQKSEAAEHEQVEAGEVGSSRKQTSSSFKSPTKAKDYENTLSEATVFLLMDRFAPC